jgi:hypothetical protein
VPRPRGTDGARRRGLLGRRRVNVTTAALDQPSQAEAERQLAAAVERHREAVSSTQDVGRSDAGQRVAIKVLGRAVELVSYALRRAAAADVGFERLVELTGWQPDLVREGLERPVPEPRVVARLAPARVDAAAVARAAASFQAVRRLHELTHRVLDDIEIDVDGDDAGEPLPAPADVDSLRERLETAWQEWRRELRRGET